MGTICIKISCMLESSQLIHCYLYLIIRFFIGPSLHLARNAVIAKVINYFILLQMTNQTRMPWMIIKYLFQNIFLTNCASIKIVTTSQLCEYIAYSAWPLGLGNWRQVFQPILWMYRVFDPSMKILKFMMLSKWRRNS